MRQLLIEKFHAYICDQHPDLLIEMKENFNLQNYLEQQYLNIEPLLLSLLKEGKPNYIIEELCLNEMAAPLKPSKFIFLKTLLADEFKGDYLVMVESGILTYEIINLIHCCEPFFESFKFSEENEGSEELKSKLTKQIRNYLIAS